MLRRQAAGFRRAAKALCRMRHESVRNKLRDQAVALGLPGGGFVTVEFDGDRSPWFQSEEILSYWGKTGFDLSDKWNKGKGGKRMDQEEGAAVWGVCSVTGECQASPRRHLT